jgi:hypothetical protein
MDKIPVIMRFNRLQARILCFVERIPDLDHFRKTAMSIACAHKKSLSNSNTPIEISDTRRLISSESCGYFIVTMKITLVRGMLAKETFQCTSPDALCVA